MPLGDLPRLSALITEKRMSTMQIKRLTRGSPDEEQHTASLIHWLHTIAGDLFTPDSLQLCTPRIFGAKLVHILSFQCCTILPSAGHRHRHSTSVSSPELMRALAAPSRPLSQEGLKKPHRRVFTNQKHEGAPLEPL